MARLGKTDLKKMIAKKDKTPLYLYHSGCGDELLSANLTARDVLTASEKAISKAVSNNPEISKKIISDVIWADIHICTLAEHVKLCKGCVEKGGRK